MPPGQRAEVAGADARDPLFRLVVGGSGDENPGIDDQIGERNPGGQRGGHARGVEGLGKERPGVTGMLGEKPFEDALGLLGAALDVEVTVAFVLAGGRSGLVRERVAGEQPAAQPGQERMRLADLDELGVADPFANRVEPRVEFLFELLGIDVVIVIDIDVEACGVDGHDGLHHPEHLMTGHLEVDSLRRVGLTGGVPFFDPPLHRGDEPRRCRLARLQPCQRHHQWRQAIATLAKDNSRPHVATKGGLQVIRLEFVLRELLLEIVRWLVASRAKRVEHHAPQPLEPAVGEGHRAKLGPAAECLEKCCRLRHPQHHGRVGRQAFPARSQVGGKCRGERGSHDRGGQPAENPEPHGESFQAGERSNSRRRPPR